MNMTQRQGGRSASGARLADRLRRAFGEDIYALKMGSADHDFIGTDQAQQVARLFVQQVQIKEIVR